MVILSRIYTKTGDGGDTGLGDGSRVAKYTPRVEAYGSVDEANSFLGLARICAGEELDAALAAIQNDLFDLGADLCRPYKAEEQEDGRQALRISEAQVERLEGEIDSMNAHLSPLKSFVLPGGSPLAANLHACRTVARRSERRIVELASLEEVNPAAIRYMNRLSDWLFVAARKANSNGHEDVLWRPGANR